MFQDLREQMDKREEQIKKLKKALKIYAKRLKSTEGRFELNYKLNLLFELVCYVSIS